MVRTALLHGVLLGTKDQLLEGRVGSESAARWVWASCTSPSGPSLDLFVLSLLNINLILKIRFSALYRCSGSVVITFMSELLF